MIDVIDRQPIHPYRRHIAIEKTASVLTPTAETISRNKARREIYELNADAALLDEIKDGFGPTGVE